MVRAYITGMGLITPLGKTVAETERAILLGRKGFKRLSLFPVFDDNPLPVGEIDGIPEENGLPRTHILARMAAEEAMAEWENPPEAIVVGTTTGGMAETEKNLRKGALIPSAYEYHAAGSVADFLASVFQCTGPVITLSTACSSSAAAIKTALLMLRKEQVRNVLVVGADSLCRLTYYGFKSLQLIDPEGAKPFDRNRKGMTVAEGAGALLLAGAHSAPSNAVAEIAGCGLSCDAWHPATPHPDGLGALKAMKRAMKDAGVSPSNIDYINLHGTGTWDNDASESAAINRLFGEKIPCHSSVKGALGHSLAAAGAIEAILSALSIQHNVIPPNTGCTVSDPLLPINPAAKPEKKVLQTVLSNSFGFGGNNAAVIIGTTNRTMKDRDTPADLPFTIAGKSLLSGAGFLKETLGKITQGKAVKGLPAEKELLRNLSAKTVRRMKRLPRMALSLAMDAWENSGIQEKPEAVFFGTGWGSLSETYRFLTQLFDSNDQFASPTDFIGSVHNAPAGQAAIQFAATGPNITATGGNNSFEQALFTADLLSRNEDGPVLVIGADEFHETFSPLLDLSTPEGTERADGGGALLLKRTAKPSGIRLSPVFLKRSLKPGDAIEALISRFGGPKSLNTRYGALFAGIPASEKGNGSKQLKHFIQASEFTGAVWDYRECTGQFASASAVAVVLAAAFAESGQIPERLCGKDGSDLQGKGILVAGFGKYVTGIGVLNHR